MAISDLSEIELFAPLSQQERQSLLKAGTTHDLQPGAKIVQTGEHGDSLYVILSGLVRVYRDMEGGQPLELARLGAGACFGEMSLLTGERRSANVSAHTAVKLLEIPKRALMLIIAHRPTLAEQLASIMAQRKLANERAIENRSPQSFGALLNETALAMAKRIREFLAL
jgi:CRP-like cAMP-binding protein